LQPCGSGLQSRCHEKNGAFSMIVLWRESVQITVLNSRLTNFVTVDRNQA
jgi:hypothetical protein